MIDPVAVDFETEAIVGNPLLHPPRPVGVAISMPGEPPRYLAWGHPQGNTTTQSEAAACLGQLARSGTPLVFHNAAFDLSVWNAYFPEDKVNIHDHSIHDTMYLLFLADPYSSTLALKPSAERYLGLPAAEQDELHQWILRNCPGATPKNAGGFIALAPGDLVARYAVGDVRRTLELFKFLYPRIVADGMGAAYDRERKLFPVVYDGTRRGIRIDRSGLAADEQRYTGALDQAYDRLCNLLGCSRSDLDSDSTFADALERSGAVKQWVLTPKSKKRSLSADNLKIEIPEVKVVMDYSSALSTCLSTFIRPWLKFSAADGRLHPNWNQVKQSHEQKGKVGTQTGRLSSDSPNFQNVPTEFVDALGKPMPTPQGLPPLPLLRRYCLPEEGHIWLKRDFSSQEVRILAHFEDGRLCEAYRADPNLDPHQMARELVHSIVGILYARKDIKITGFSLIYGTGVNGLSLQLGRPYDEAAAIKSAYLGAMPDVRDLMQEVQRRGRRGDFIRTWGGRVYYAEPSRVIEGRIRDFAYKLLNYLIQGSAADQTKQSIIDWEATRSKTDIFLATVHDEINISAPKEDAEGAMRRLKEAMNADRLDVPMLSEGFRGPNWADIEECE